MKMLRMLGLAAVVSLWGCGGGSAKDAGVSPDGGPPDTAVDAGREARPADSGEALGMFEAWEQARAALRQSPDHLPGKADALVKEGDPAKLFQFVRDDIMTYPPSDDSFVGCVTAQRWGVQGTLRGGAGTPREKAELLASLYRRARLTAELVVGQADPSKIDGKAVLLRSHQRRFAQPITADQATAWNRALGHDGGTKHTAIDPDGSEANALSTQLLASMPAQASPNFDFTLSDIPLVRVQVQGAWRYANPIAPGAAFGDSLTLDTPTIAPDADAPPEIRVALQAARADDPFTRFTLLDRTYQAGDVVGRRIHLAFAPLLSPEKLAQVRVADIETLVPVMNVSAPGMAQAERDRLAVVGDAFSRGGDLYQIEGQGLSVNGTPLLASQPGAASRVARVGVSAQPGNFPRVELGLSAQDGTGLDVEGLGADAISVSDNGQPVSFSLTQNQAPPPKVVLIYDTSSSIPEEFRGAGAVASAGRIVDGIFAKFPNAQVRVGTAFFGAEWMAPTWAGTLAEAQSQVAALASASGDSTLWESVLDAEAEHPTLIVLFSDGDSEDEITPEIANSIAAGPPILTVGVGGVVPDSLRDMALRSNGRYLPVSGQSEAETAVADALNVNAKTDYLVTFQAPSTPGPHAVTVKIGGVTGTTTYEVPAKPTAPPALPGLYLTLRVGQREATRALAGYARAFTTDKPIIDQTTLDDVTALLFGRVSIAVEAESPTAAVVLDDWIAEKRTLKPLWDAIGAKDAAAITAALKQGVSLTPGKLPLAQPPLRDAAGPTGLTFATAPHLAAMVQKVRPGKAFSRELDLFPMNRWMTAAPDGRAAWQKTFKATAALAIMEKHMMRGTSTAKLLAGQKLSALPSGQANLQAGLSDDERLRWAALEEPFPSTEFTLLVPSKPGAFWAVDNLSGTLVGILPDGSGGGNEDACSTYNFANNALTLAGLLGGFAGASIGGWVALMEWEVKYVTIATIVISGGTPSGDTSMGNPALDMGCGMIDDALGEVIPGLGEYEQIVDTLDLGGIDTGAPSVCGNDEGPC